MLEVLFMVENGTTSQLTSCWSTFMHSTSSYDAQSKCPHNVECAKHWENEGWSFGKCWTWFWAAPSRLSFLTCAAHDLGWEVHRHVCIFLGPSCIDRPMDLPSEVLFLAAQLTINSTAQKNINSEKMGWIRATFLEAEMWANRSKSTQVLVNLVNKSFSHR